MVLLVFGLMPLLGAGAIAAKAVSNAQLQTVNDEFLPKAWHNLPADRFFPDRFGVQGHNGHEFYAWARQGIDDATGCDDPGLEPELADAVNEHGCQAVVRATYIDPTASLVTTIVVAAVGSPADAESIGEEFSVAAGEHEGPFALAFPVAGTPAELWTDEDRAGSSVEAAGSYVVTVVVGYVDGRPVDVLPEPWTLPAPGSANERALDDIAYRAEAAYWEQVYSSIREMTR